MTQNNFSLVGQYGSQVEKTNEPQRRNYQMSLTNQLIKSRLDNLNLETINQILNGVNSSLSIVWAAETFRDGLIVTTSFGIQSAVTLHLVTQICPDIPVVWIDTGYLPQETYQFAEELTTRLQLNLKVYQSSMSPLRMEAKYGKLWEQNDVESLNLYDRIRKVEPMERALTELKATGWIAGLRRQQTDYRQQLSTVTRQGDRFKVLPILNWTAQDVDNYLKTHNLPYHPLHEQGYVTVGDWHSSRPLTVNDFNERDTRFQGMKQECGLHLPTNSAIAA